MHTSQKLATAFAYAERIHRKQKRKGSGITPYIAHPMAVASLVLENGGDEDQAIAGLLHDSIEDQNETREHLRIMFGEDVAQMVVDCTHAKIDWKAYPKEMHPDLLRQNRIEYFEHIRTMPVRSALIVGCDKVHNGRSLWWEFAHPISGGFAVLKKFRGGVEGTPWYYREVGRAVASHDGTPGGTLRRLGEEIEHLADRIDLSISTLTAGG